ncbi:hypothetical protein BOVA115_852 [Bacteroides ovatus]|nr:hypothetical protein BOVA115_852 [Bacteroides ovatus]
MIHFNSKGMFVAVVYSYNICIFTANNSKAGGTIPSYN